MEKFIKIIVLLAASLAVSLLTPAFGKSSNLAPVLGFVLNEDVPVAGGLMINEVSSTYYTNSERWFELYNSTDNPIDISTYSFKARGHNSVASTYSSSSTFSLPAVMVPAKGYVVVRAQYGSPSSYNNAQMVFVKSGDIRPYWSTSGGFIELLGPGGQTLDFVRFNNSAAVPTTGADWDSSWAPDIPYGIDQYGKSIARVMNAADNNTGTDWLMRDFSTFAGQNDIDCSDDTDSDGIPDCAEEPGTTYAGLPMYEWGARKMQTDLFLNVNYMASADEGIVPRREALEKMASVFATQGYTVHYDVGDLYDNNAGTDAADMDMGGGGSIPYVATVHLGCSSDGKSARELKAEHMDARRRQVFYYALFGSSQNADGSSGSSGCAELTGNDMIVTLGNWGLNSGNTVQTNYLINFQAGTLMHEFGHILGLRHGGNENENYKPNYYSVMNYLHQLAGLPQTADAGDRYRYRRNRAGNASCLPSSSSSLPNGPSGPTAAFDMNYSFGTFSSLVETGTILEASGLGHASYDDVDYNCDGDATDSLVSFNANPDESASLTTLTDYNDWSNIQLVFARGYSGDVGPGKEKRLPSSALYAPNAINDEEKSIFWSDIQPTAEEPPIDIPDF